MNEVSSRNGDATLAALSGIGVVVGSLGPWIQATLPFVGTVSVSGTDGDGQITLLAGGLAGILMAIIAFGSAPAENQRTKIIIAGIAYGLVAGVVAYDWISIEDRIDSVDSEFRHLISAGWGIYVTGLSGLLGALATVQVYIRLREREIEHL